MDKTVVDPSSASTKAANENVSPAESNKQSENDAAADKDGTTFSAMAWFESLSTSILCLDAHYHSLMPHYSGLHCRLPCSS